MEDVKLSLLDHLQELRSRLWRVTIAVLVLGGLSIAYAREIFGFLMRPVLAALPEGSRALVYTSGIEEINVLLKVGLYAGLFLAIPVALYQVWLFVAPGLLKQERRLIGPFVLLGSLFFIGGAAFCYYAVLPSMFQFLLSPGDRADARQQIATARGKLDDASRLLWLGETARAAELAAQARKDLAAPASNSPAHSELATREERFERLLDAAIAHPGDERRREALLAAASLNGEARADLAAGQLTRATQRLDDAGKAFTRAFDESSGAALAVWEAERDFAAGSANLAAQDWTRPMLSMNEQLSLVLVLEIAFGGIFELPLIMALLAMMGILRARWVIKGQRYAIIACVVAAAIITPTGDVINLSLMAVPMIFCFELGVILVWIFEKRRNRAPASDEAAPGELQG